jgi:hypothetical protein
MALIARCSVYSTSCLMVAGLLPGPAAAQGGAPIVRTSTNRPLASVRQAAAKAPAPAVRATVREVPNFRGAPQPAEGVTAPDGLLQPSFGSGPTSVATFFEGADNETNLATVGFRVSPPDTDGDVGPNHYVQMINMVTTVYNKAGGIVDGPFATNSFWSGQGGNCEAYNQGDPVVVYDEAGDRWLVSQFAFDDNFTTFSQCVAVSQTGDPAGAYNRYEFSFDGIGLPDYPKHGIVSDSITMIANIFAPPTFNFTGTFLGVMDKAAMYAGNPATLVGFNLGTREFGFVAGDRDGTGNIPALFATAMSNRKPRFDIWRVDPNFAAGTGTATRIHSLPIASYDADLCSASREACVPQPGGAPSLEALSDRLMHRLQIRDFGTYRSMMAAHTVDVGGGRAGVRWYELRETGGTWSLYQQGTYAPGDGLHRWVPSIAKNAAGDIGLGFLVSSTTRALSIHLTGQTAAASGSGTMDGDEVVCRAGVTAQTGTPRAGDYSATNVDPVTGAFWHTNEYGQRNDKSAGWGTAVCAFSLSTTSTCTDGDGDGWGDPGSASCSAGATADCNDSNPAVNPGATEACSNGLDDDCDGFTDAADPSCGSPVDCSALTTKTSCSAEATCRWDNRTRACVAR